MSEPIHPTLAEVTRRIEQRSARTRAAYLEVVSRTAPPGPYRSATRPLTPHRSPIGDIDGDTGGPEKKNPK